MVVLTGLSGVSVSVRRELVESDEDIMIQTLSVGKEEILLWEDSLRIYTQHHADCGPSVERITNYNICTA